MRRLLTLKRTPAQPVVPAADPASAASRAMAADMKRLYKKGWSVAIKTVGAMWADDAVVQSFTALWDLCYKDGELPKEPVDALFFTILHRRIADRQRSETSVQGREENASYIEDVVGDIHRRTNTMLVAEGAMLSARVDYLVATFPPEMRRAMQALKANEWHTKDAAQAIGMNYELMKWHRRNGISRLRQQLLRDGYQPPAAMQDSTQGKP